MGTRIVKSGNLPENCCPVASGREPGKRIELLQKIVKTCFFRHGHEVILPAYWLWYIDHLIAVVGRTKFMKIN